MGPTIVVWSGPFMASGLACRIDAGRLQDQISMEMPTSARVKGLTFFNGRAPTERCERKGPFGIKLMVA